MTWDKESLLALARRVCRCPECGAETTKFGGTGSMGVEGLVGFVHVQYSGCDNGHRWRDPSDEVIAGWLAATETCDHDWETHPTGTPKPWRGCNICSKLEYL